VADVDKYVYICSSNNQNEAPHEGLRRQMKSIDLLLVLMTAATEVVSHVQSSIVVAGEIYCQ
jgi:hypothetical protein